MSVAFRREGDEEHLEPKFELPLPTGPNLVTARGLALIGQRVEDLEAEIARATIDEDRLKALRRDLRYWHTRQSTAELAALPTGDTVAFGTQVTYRLKGAIRSIAIVGDDEADPARGRVSFSAPLSRAMMGARAGDIVAFAGDGDAIEVLSVTCYPTEA